MAPKHRLPIALAPVVAYLLIGYSLVIATPAWFTSPHNHANIIRACVFDFIALISFCLLITLIDYGLSNDHRTFWQSLQENTTNMCGAILAIVTVVSLYQIVHLGIQSLTHNSQVIVNQFSIAAFVFIAASTLLLALITGHWRQHESETAPDLDNDPRHSHM